MNMPQFTAQASLYRSSYRYRSLGQRGELQTTVVIPQIPNKDAPGRAGCISDCLDKHPDWKRDKCERACNDPGGIYLGVGYGPFCEASPPDECYKWGVACCAGLGEWGCLFICPGLVQTCLENSRRECLIATHGPLRGGSSYPRSGVIHVDVTEEFPFLVT